MPENRKFFVTLLFGGVVAIIFFGSLMLYKNYFRPLKAPEPEIRLIEGFPQLPVYPQAILVDSSKIEIDNGEKFQGIWESSDSVPETVRWYQDKLANEGWKIDILPADPSAQDIQLLVLWKADKILNLSFVQKDNQTGTTITAEIVPKNSPDDEPEEGD